MIARCITVHLKRSVSVGTIDSFVALLPHFKRKPGFAGGLIMHDLQAGEVRAITLWESMEHHEGTVASITRAAKHFADQCGAPDATVEVTCFEVATSSPMAAVEWPSPSPVLRTEALN